MQQIRSCLTNGRDAPTPSEHMTKLAPGVKPQSSTVGAEAGIVHIKASVRAVPTKKYCRMPSPFCSRLRVARAVDTRLSTSHPNPFHLVLFRIGDHRSHNRERWQPYNGPRPSDRSQDLLQVPASRRTGRCDRFHLEHRTTQTSDHCLPQSGTFRHLQRRESQDTERPPKRRQLRLAVVHTL
jgi:hypothetical protein